MAQANPNNVAALQPTTYREHYSTMTNVMNGTYTAYLTPFGNESGEQPATLRDRILFGANDVPKVFALVQINPTPRIVFIHWPTRYGASLQGVQPWDNCVFGFQGNLFHGNQTNLVEWPKTPFLRTAMMTVPQFKHMEAAWQAAGGADALGPFGANEPHMEQLRAHSIIVQDQAVQDCAVLVHWARVACTYGPAGLLPNAAQPMVPLGIVGGLCVPLLDDTLSARCWSWVLEDLPALGRTGTTLERQFLQQNTTLGNLLQQQVDDAAAARQADWADKEFSQVYPQAAVEIKMLCKAATEAELPPIWKILANIEKKEVVIAVNHLLEERTQEADSFKKVAPVVTPELLKRIFAFKSGAPDVDDITAGFSLFLLITGSPEAMTQAWDRAVVYGLLQSGHVAPSLEISYEKLSQERRRSPER